MKMTSLAWEIGILEVMRIKMTLQFMAALGTIRFSVFDEQPIQLKTEKGDETLNILHPENVQLHHVEQMRDQLLNPLKTHPSSGQTGAHTSWIMDKILGNI